MSVSQQRVGPVSPSADGTIVPIRASRDGAQINQDAHARYQEAVFRGNVFVAANNAGSAIPATLAAACTGLILTNPPASTRNLVLMECIVAPTATISQVSAIVLAYTGSLGTNVVHTTPLTITNALLGSPNKSSAFADSSATLPSIPYVVRALASLSGSLVPIKDIIDGALILAPGSAIATFSLTTASTAITSMTWEEIPI